jgi:mRNA-degrading endonuclease RelE of RelBE toxin-antitoxin system
MTATGKGASGDKSKPSSPFPYTVEMTAAAERVYKDLYSKCKTAESLGHPESIHCKIFRIVEEAVKKIIPHDPINKGHALRGNLSNIFRLRKRRMRIMWIASSARRRVCILFISETVRKEGDKNDPYQIFEDLLDSGVFDQALKQLGVKRAAALRR